MNELCTTAEMIERIKDILSRHLNDAVHDWHVADILGMSGFTLASRKMRDSPPLKEIVLFCDRCGLNPLDIVMKKSC